MAAIEQNIPVPQRASKYPLFQMEVGDLFLIPFREGMHKQTRRRMHVAVCLAVIRCRDRTGWQFKTRQVDGGVRCWRTD